MKDAIPKHLGEEDLNAPLSQGLEIDPGGLELREIADRNPRHPLHDHHVLAGQVKIDPRDFKHLRIHEAAADIGGIGGLPDQIQFIEEGFLKLLNDLQGPQAPGFGPDLEDQLGECFEEIKVRADALFNPRAEHLDDHRIASLEGGGMHLRHRGRGQRLCLKIEKEPVQWLPQRGLDGGDGLSRIKWRDAVLELHQFCRDIIGQEIPAGREGLAKFDKDGPEVLQRLADADASRGLCRGFSDQALNLDPAPCRKGQTREVNEFIKTPSDENRLDAPKSAERGGLNHGMGLKRESIRRGVRASGDRGAPPGGRQRPGPGRHPGSGHRPHGRLAAGGIPP